MPKKKATSSNLRAIMFDTLTKVTSGLIDVKHSNAASKAASTINQSLRFDIEKERLDLKKLKSTPKTKSIEL